MSTTLDYSKRVNSIWKQLEILDKSVFIPNKEFRLKLKSEIKKAINKAYSDGFKAGRREYDRLNKEIELDKEW